MNDLYPYPPNPSLKITLKHAHIHALPLNPRLTEVVWH